MILILSSIINFFPLRNLENQCWKKKDFADSLTEEDYKFLLYEKDSKKLLVTDTDSDKVLAEDIELIMKQNGFLDDDASPTPSSLMLSCEGTNNWKYQSDDGAE